ncbi:MAG: FkbM family methyltransferase [Parvularculaceae bacterium]
MTAPFGEHRPTEFQERMRAAARTLPDNYVGRKAASLLLGPAGGRTGRAFDVDIFGGARARLHPHDNICEKRVYLTPQHWDAEERRFLAEIIARHEEKEFVFADIGANAGLYSLFACSECRKHTLSFRGIAVEPDREMQRRLTFNLEASGAKNEVRLFACAVSSSEGNVLFSVNEASRGMSRISSDGEISTPARPLADILAEAAANRLDFMKIDIEGHEHAVLEPFFSEAPRHLHPRWIQLEISHEIANLSAEELTLRAGYRIAKRTRLNSILERIA